MSEEKSIVAAPPPPAPDLGVIGPPPKRKKGRPPKNRALLPGGESSTAPVPPKADGRGRKPKRKNGDVVWPAVDSTYVGQQVHGVLDGSFDAGYLLTVRVGNTQTVLRGAVFEPSLSVPISQSNDIAPNVKFVSRGELAAPPLPCLTEHANACTASPSAPPVNSGINDRAPVPMEEDKRLPSVAPPPLVPSGVAKEDQKDTAPLQLSDQITEERTDSQVEPRLQTV